MIESFRGLSLFRTFSHGIRVQSLLLSLIAGSLFWSTAAVEIFSVLFLLSSIPLINRKEIRRYSVPLVLWTGYFLGVIVSLVLSGMRGLQTVHFSAFWHPLLFPAAVLVRCSKAECATILRVVVCSVSAACIASLSVYVLTGPAYAEPVASTLTAFSILNGLSVGPILFLLIREKNVRRQLLYGTAFVLIALEVCFSARFVAIGLFLLGTLIFLPFAGKKFLPVITAVPLIALFLSPDATWYKLSYLIGAGMTDRFLLWEGGLGLLRNLPLFGYGPGSFHEVIPGNVSAAFMYAAPSSWHNDYLAVLLESGWLTAMFFSGGVVLGCALLVRVLVKPDAGDRKLSGALWISLELGIAIAAGTSSVISTAILGVALWIIQGGVAAFLLSRGESQALPFDLNRENLSDESVSSGLV